MSKNDVVKAVVLGQLPAALSVDVSLATPLTMSRIEGRDEVVGVLRQLADSFGIGEPEFITADGERDFVTFVGSSQGHEVGLFAVLTRGAADTYSAVDLYARPWPFVKLVRDQLAASDERFRDDIDLSAPYAPDGPPGGFLAEQPAGLPELSADVVFHSPVLTDTASGSELVGFILNAVGEISGAPRFRIVSGFDQGFVMVYDATVHGHTWQLAGVCGLDGSGRIDDMRIYSRPWPVTAFFRGEGYKLMRDRLGPQYWQGEDPLAVLGEADTAQ
ncbi:hypothetical protein [Kitasatospora sp. NPDC059571]|uniref:hypothetical protein n=1 Tax=Kitasatospora sp. NPDC059571 TaxID=3346871 RepID=UPI0036B68958